MSPERFSKSKSHNQSTVSSQEGNLVVSFPKATTAGSLASQESNRPPLKGRCVNCVKSKVKCQNFIVGPDGPSCKTCTLRGVICAFKPLSVLEYPLGPAESANLSSASKQGGQILRASIAGTSAADYAIPASKNATQYTHPDDLLPYERKYSVRPGADLSKLGIDAQQRTSHDDTLTPDDEQGLNHSDSSTMTEKIMGPESIRALTATNDSPGFTDVGHDGTRTGLLSQNVVAIDEPLTMAPSHGLSRPSGSYAAPHLTPSGPGKAALQADQLQGTDASIRSVDKWDLQAYRYLFAEGPSPTD